MRSVIPPHISAALARHPDPAVRAAALRTLAASARKRAERELATFALRRRRQPPLAGAVKRRLVYDAGGQEQDGGALAREEDGFPAADPVVNNAFDAAGTVWDFWQQTLGRLGWDDANAAMVSVCHWGDHVDNAMWDGSVIDGGDGDGVVFNNFFAVPDVIFHEWSHARSSGLRYQGESGGLEESCADCGAMACWHWSARLPIAQASPYIGGSGPGIFTAAVSGNGLRSMAAPGEAYDDPQLGGKDPQIADYKDYAPWLDVHLTSGIGNKAFWDACLADGGGSWERVYPCWFWANQHAPHGCTFAHFADLCRLAAQRQGWGGTAANIAIAWNGVGVAI